MTKRLVRGEDGLLRALVLGGVGVWAVTEWCSVFHALKPLPMLACWAFLAPALFIAWKELKTPLPEASGGKDSLTKAVGIFLAAEVTLLLIIALVAAPGTWDSMTYHLARVAHWASQMSLEHYPTFIPRQLYISPWAEYAILQGYVMLGSDGAANLVQWFSFVGGLCAVHLLTLRLGGTSRAAALATLFMATAPMVILQATSTQTDLASGFWCVASVYYSLTWKEDRRWQTALLAALAGALAVFTKTSSFFFLAPFCILALFLSRLKGAATYVALFALCTAALHGPHFLRNHRSFGSIAGPAAEVAGMNNQVYGVGAVLANAARHYGLNLGTHIEPLNRATTAAVRGFCRLMGTDPDDPRSTSSSNYVIQRLSTHEDIAANPLQALLILALPLAALWRRRRGTMPWGYLAAGVASFLFLSAFLRVASFNVRIHVPFFVLLAPWAGIGLDRLLKPRALTVLAAVLAVPSLYWVFCNFSRPLLRPNAENPPSILLSARADQYFNNRDYLRDEYGKVMDRAEAAGCRHFVMILGNDSWEYPLWALARRKGGQWRFDHLVDKNRPTEACALFSDRRIDVDVMVAGARFKPVLVGERVYLLLRER